MAVLTTESAEQALAEVRQLTAAVRALALEVLRTKDELERLEGEQRETKSQLQNAQLDLLRLASVPVPEAPEVVDLSSTEDLELFVDLDKLDRYDHAPSSTNAATGYRPDFGAFDSANPL